VTDAPENWTKIILAFLAGSAAGIPALLGWLSSRRTHRLVNSRMAELLELTRRSSKAEGIAGEKQRVADLDEYVKKHHPS
jgi:hypothetical protein